MPSVTPPAPIAAHSLLVFLLQVGLLLLAALLLGRLAARFGLPAVAGELCAGIVFGPSLFGHLAPGLCGWLIPRTATQFHLLDAVGQLGVVLLVGVTGIEIDVALVRRQGASALRVGVAGLVIPLALGATAGYLAPRELVAGSTGRGTFALFVGVAMCVSALPVIAKTLSDMKLLHRAIGQLTIASAVVDDVSGWLLLSVVSAMAVSGVHGRTVALSVAYLAAFVLAAVFLGRPLVRAVFARAQRSGEAGPAVAAAVVVMVLCAAATQAMGFEAMLGAFFGGLMIGSCGGVDLARLAPLRSVVMWVFAPLFFATAGLRMDLTALGRGTVLLAAAAALAVAVAGKFAGAFLGATASRLSRWEALALASGMNARGVIQIVVATAGLSIGVLNTAGYTIIILVAIVTSIMVPPVLRFAVKRIEYTEEEEIRRRTMAVFREPALAAASSGVAGREEPSSGGAL